MNLKLIFGIISTVFAIVCFLPYFKDIFAKKTKPHIYSWLVWSILQSVGVVAIVRGGGHFGALGLAVGALFCISIFFLSFKYGTKNITRFDTLCLIGSIATIIVWLLQHNPTLSVILVTLIDFVAFLPTYRKGYVDPNSETVPTYLLSAISNVFALLAIASYSLVTSLYVSSLVVSNGIIVLILILRKKYLRPI
ncbi:MAG: hypothetical protein WCV85_02230 [Patescibacteria group bacterium]|jgi:hypothetical protein